jgi:outer membrane lipoprotein SlyB
METQASPSKSLHPLIWVVGIAIILFSAIGIGALMGWIPTSTSGSGNASLPEQQAENLPVPAPVTAKTHKAPTRQATRPPVQAAESAPARTSQAIARCSECGVIESVREIETKGEGSGLGAVGGGVMGGLIGNQVGGGRGKDVMTVIGAVGGAMAGNEVEKRTKSTKSYAITIRFDDGSSRVFSEANAPMWRAGDKVKIVNGLIQSNS